MVEVETGKTEQQARGIILTIVNPVTGAGIVRKNFTKIPNSIIFDKRVKAQDKELYNILLALPYRKRQGAGDGILINHKYLCKLTGAKTKLTIINSIKRLEAAGYCKYSLLNGQLADLQVIIKPAVSEIQEQELAEMVSGIQLENGHKLL